MADNIHMSSHIDIPGEIIEKWQNVADLLADILDIPAALVVKVHRDKIKVFISSRSKDNPYQVGDTENLYGSYSGIVVEGRDKLWVKNALKDSRWRRNPNTKPEMISYFGYPIEYPDKTPFGALCVLDRKERTFSKSQQQLLLQLKQLIETDLLNLKKQQVIVATHRQNKKTEQRNKLLGQMLEAVPTCIIILDLNGQILYANQKTLTLHQYTREEFMKLPFEVLNDSSSQENIDRRLKEVKDKGELFFNTCHTRKDGTILPLEVYAKMVTWEDRPAILSASIDVSRWTEAKEALEESKQDLKRAQSMARIGTWRFDFNTGMVIASKVTRDIYGVLEDALTIQQVQTIPLRRYRTMLDRALKELIEEGKPYDVVFEIRRPADNRVRYIHSIADYYEKQNMVIGTIQDITELREAERERWRSENRFRSFVENANDIVYALSPQGVFTYLSPNWQDFVGISATEAVGKRATDFVHPDDVALCNDFLQRVLATGEKQRGVEYRVKHRDGSWRWHVSNGSPIRDTEGNVVEYMGIARDVTERKRSESALAAEKERLAVTLRSIGDAVITTDTQGRVMIMNSVAEQLTGWTQAQAQGIPLSDIFTIINEQTRRPSEDPVKKILSTGKTIELANHTVLISRDGTERPIADSGAPIRDNNGNIIGVVLVFRDMTEKQKLMDAAQRADKLESLGILAGGIAHDFNNLLGGIYGYIDIANECTTEHTVSRYLHQALNTIDRARGLTQQLLTFAKGGAPVKNIEQLSSFIQDTVQFALSGSSVTAQFDLPFDLWPCDVDKEQIGQVIDNIIINAVQAMPAGGKIEIGASNIAITRGQIPDLSAGDYVRICIRDFGVGIPKEYLSHIFDPFYSTKAKGHGLGLATCYSILDRHGGSIDVQSQPGVGTVFFLYLPAIPDAVPAPVGGVNANTFEGEGTFVVMDDEEVMQNTMKAMLETFGFRVVLTSDGREAVDFFRKETHAGRWVAGMIFDLTIPGGQGGKQAIEQIRKLSSDAVVFVSSGYSEDPVMANPGQFGFTASICKPFRRVELAQLLREHMRNGGNKQKG